MELLWTKVNAARQQAAQSLRRTDAYVSDLLEHASIIGDARTRQPTCMSISNPVTGTAFSWPQPSFNLEHLESSSIEALAQEIKSVVYAAMERGDLPPAQK